MKKILLISVFLLFCMGVAFSAAPEATQLNYSPSPAIPGSTIDVLIQLENNENIAQEGVTVKIDNNYPFTVFGENEINIGNMEKHGKALAKFVINVDPSAENKTYSLPVIVKSLEQPSGKGKSFSIIISGKDPIVKVVGFAGDVLSPGEEKKLTFLLKNIGTSPAYNVLLELQEDRTVTATGVVVEREITPLGASTAYVPQINPGEEKKVVVDVSVNRDAEQKNYTLPVEISYRDSSGTRSTTTSYVGFNVVGNVDLDVILKEKTSALVAGIESTITFEIFNKGSGKAEYTLVNISTENIEVDKSKQFIGALEPNDVDSFKTTFKPSLDYDTKETNITLAITYQGADAKTKTQIINVPVKVYSQIDGAAFVQQNPFGVIINLIIIIVVVFIVWKGYKKFKKK